MPGFVVYTRTCILVLEGEVWRYGDMVDTFPLFQFPISINSYSQNLRKFIIVRTRYSVYDVLV